MASKTISDNGPAQADYIVRRRGADVIIQVTIRTDDGDAEHVELSREEVIDATTAQERADIAAGLASVYAAATIKGGFA